MLIRTKKQMQISLHLIITYTFAVRICVLCISHASYAWDLSLIAEYAAYFEKVLKIGVCIGRKIGRDKTERILVVR